MTSNNELPLRIGVGILLLNNENKIFVGKRIDNPKNFWQMPQGGVDKNEKGIHIKLYSNLVNMRCCLILLFLFQL